MLVPRLNRLFKRFWRLLSKREDVYPFSNGNELLEVADVLSGKQWNMTYGKDLKHHSLEKEFAKFIGAEHAIAVASGGMGIQMTLRALGLNPGDEVVHQIDTCVANPFSIINAGATPIFCDIDKDSYLIDQNSLTTSISEKTKALMPIHMWGNVEAMDSINEIAKKNGLFILEDCCLSLGSTNNNQHVGLNGDASIFSFGCIKPIQAGEGGIIATNDAHLANTLREIRNYGDSSFTSNQKDHNLLSWNGRMPEVIAAIAKEQLKTVPEFIEKIQSNVAYFKEQIHSITELNVVDQTLPNSKSSYAQVVLKLEESISKNQLMKGLKAQNIPVWHANFELINSFSFFQHQEKWQKWLSQSDPTRVLENYTNHFKNATYVFEKGGIGLDRNLFTSKRSIDKLVLAINKCINLQRA